MFGKVANFLGFENFFLKNNSFNLVSLKFLECFLVLIGNKNTQSKSFPFDSSTELTTWTKTDHRNSGRTNDNLKVQKRKQDEERCLHTELETLPSLVVLKTHDDCISRYTSSYYIEKYLDKKRKKQLQAEAPQTKFSRRSSGSSSFVWKLHCLFCGELCALERRYEKPKAMTQKWSSAKSMILRKKISRKTPLFERPSFRKVAGYKLE